MTRFVGSMAALALGACALCISACGDDERPPYSAFSTTGPGVPNAGMGQGSPSTPASPPGGGNATGAAGATGDGGGAAFAGDAGPGGTDNTTSPGGPPGAPPAAGDVPSFFENVGESNGTQVPGFFGAGNDIGIPTQPGPQGP